MSYGKINPRDATEIFIREGLVNDTVKWPFDFLGHNREVRQKVENILTRTRDSGFLNLDEAIYRFYAVRLENVTAVAELVDIVRERKGAEPDFLEMQAEDLRDPETLAQDTTAFPEALPFENRALALNYAYRPGQVDDVVTLDVNVREAETLTPKAIDWAVPGHLQAKVEHYLKALPKELRRAFVPLAETAKSVAEQLAARDRLTDRRESLTEALAVTLNERFRISISPDIWTQKPLHDHLRVRVRLLDDNGNELCASRELEEIRRALEARQNEASTLV